MIRSQSRAPDDVADGEVGRGRPTARPAPSTASLIRSAPSEPPKTSTSGRPGSTAELGPGGRRRPGAAVDGEDLGAHRVAGDDRAAGRSVPGNDTAQALANRADETVGGAGHGVLLGDHDRHAPQHRGERHRARWRSRRATSTTAGAAGAPVPTPAAGAEQRPQPTSTFCEAELALDAPAGQQRELEAGLGHEARPRCPARLPTKWISPVGLRRERPGDDQATAGDARGRRHQVHRRCRRRR